MMTACSPDGPIEPVLVDIPLEIESGGMLRLRVEVPDHFGHWVECEVTLPDWGTARPIDRPLTTHSRLSQAMTHRVVGGVGGVNWLFFASSALEVDTEVPIRVSCDEDGNIGVVTGTTLVKARPTPDPDAIFEYLSEGATAICSDGTFSYSANRSGTCSHHGGVAQWLTTVR